MVRKILSENEVQVTVVGVSRTRPDDVFEGAGKAAEWTSGVAIMQMSRRLRVRQWAFGDWVMICARDIK